MKFNLKKQFSILAIVTGFAATATISLAGECRVAEASMDKPGGFPDRALTMIVPYGPGGGSGQIAAAMAEAVTELTVNFSIYSKYNSINCIRNIIFFGKPFCICP